MATYSLVDRGAWFPGRVMYGCCSHWSLSSSMASMGDGMECGSIAARRPGQRAGQSAGKERAGRGYPGRRGLRYEEVVGLERRGLEWTWATYLAVAVPARTRAAVVYQRPSIQTTARFDRFSQIHPDESIRPTTGTPGTPLLITIH